MPLHGTRGAASALGFGFGGGASGLYPFTAFTFLPYNETSAYGPTRSELLTLGSYSAQSWTSNTSFFDVTSGVQYWKVPKTGVYEFNLSGAAGGGATQSGEGRAWVGGLPALINGRISLTEGDTIKILVGQKGQSSPSNAIYTGGGGGGGTFVATSSNSPLFVAAGGQGAVADADNTGRNGTNGSYTGTKNASYKNNNASGAEGGTVGNGGIIDENFPQRNSAGGGFNSNGQDSNNLPYGSTYGGRAFVNNGQGSTITSADFGGNGGYGGGCSSTVRKGGAAGGYSGGNGASTASEATSNAIGASATSYIIGSASNTSSSQSSTRSAGYVTVTFIA